MKSKIYRLSPGIFDAITSRFINSAQEILYRFDPFERFSDYEWVKERSRLLKSEEDVEPRIVMARDRQQMLKKAQNEYSIAGGDLDWLRPLERYEIEAGLEDERDLWMDAKNRGVKIRVLATALNPNTRLDTLELANDLGADVRRYSTPSSDHVRAGYIDDGEEGQIIFNILGETTKRVEGKSQRPGEGIWVVFKPDNVLGRYLDRLYNAKFEKSEKYREVMNSRYKKNDSLSKAITSFII